MRKTVLWSVTALAVLWGSLAAGQTAETRRLMKEKLVASQRILEALTTSNFAVLERESQTLVRITQSPRWAALKAPELRVYADAFIKASGELAAAAERRDLDAAAASYGPLTTSCYNCHRRLKDSRLAGWAR